MTDVRKDAEAIVAKMLVFCEKSKKASVITSYSIHYTKLYEKLVLNAMKDGGKLSDYPSYFAEKADSFNKRLAAIVNMDKVNAKVSEVNDRITSYNVCYTKLLRMEL